MGGLFLSSTADASVGWEATSDINQGGKVHLQEIRPLGLLDQENSAVLSAHSWGLGVQ